jgi:hypothetical protein
MPFPRPAPVPLAALSNASHPDDELPNERLAMLERARRGIWEALALPGLEGQASLFARLEDLQQAMQAVQQDANLRAQHAAETARLVQACRQTLERVGQVFAFLEVLLSERTATAAGHHPESLPWATPGGNREAAACRAYGGGAGHGSRSGMSPARFGGGWEG